MSKASSVAFLPLNTPHRLIERPPESLHNETLRFGIRTSLPLSDSLGRILSMKKPILASLLVLCLPVCLFPSSKVPRRAADFNHSFCGTYPGRVHDEMRKAKDFQRVLRARRASAALADTSRTFAQDIGNVAVIEDDGTIVAPANPFDLANLDLKMTPNASGSYTISRQPPAINQDFGTRLALTDDDFRQISFQGSFRFPFFGTSYSSVFINSDGNITFVQGDAEHTDRDLTRLNGGSPRIAPLLNDFDPSLRQGGVYFNQLSDRFQVTWRLVQEFGGSSGSTFQLSLFPDGSFEFGYGSVSVTLGVTGWSGGGNQSSINVVNFANLASSSVSGPVAERFAQDADIDFTALAKKFYQTHSDDYDQLAVYTNFPYAIGGDTFAYEVTIKNDIQGINQDLFDFSQEFGSAGRLQSYLALNQLSVFPNDVDATAVRTYSTVEVVAHEAAHRWLAYPVFRNGTVNSEALLGYQLAHWSFFFNADASVMEGHLIQDNGNGTFTITAATNRYGKLDQYLMGLRNAADVGPLFYVQPVTRGHAATDVTDLSDIGLTFSGTRRDLTVQDIIAAEGPRVPDVPIAPKTFRQATVLLLLQGTKASNADTNKLNQIQQRLQSFFVQATDGLGTLDTRLQGVSQVPVISSIAPSSGSTLGNTPIYISGNNFQNGLTVSFGAVAATSVQIVSSSLVIAVTPPGSAGLVDVVVNNLGAQSGQLSNGYSYRSLTPVAVSSNALRIPHIVDSLFFRSNLGINNLNAVAANVRVLLLDNNGLLVNQLDSLSIPPNGFIQENSLLRTLEGTDGPSGREGSLVLESDQPIQAFVSQIDNQSGDPSILDGVRQGASRLILQSAANTGSFRSNLVVLNLSSNIAFVSVTAFDGVTGQPTGIRLENLSIAGNGFASFDNILAVLGLNNAFGPIEIRATNGAALAAISRVSGLAGNTSGFFVAQAADSGSLSEIIPFVIDTDSFRTNLGLNNLGTGTASVNITLIGADASVRASTSSPIEVASLGLVQINNILRFLLTGSGSSPVTQQQGYLKITSNQPIKAFATEIDNLTQDPSIENSAANGSSSLLLKSSANTNFQSSLVIENPNSSATTVTLIAREGGTQNNGAVTGTRTVNIPPNGYFFSNNVLEDIGATSDFGPIEIHTNPDVPVIAVSRVYSTTGNTSGFFSAQSLP